MGVQGVEEELASPQAPDATPTSNRVPLWRRLARPHNVFLGIGSVFGVAFLLLQPPFVSCDEYDHFFRSYHISEFHPSMFRLHATKRFLTGAELPSSVQAVGLTVKDYLPVPITSLQTREYLKALWNVPLKPQVRAWCPTTPGVAQFTWVCYWPYAAGIAVGRVFELRPLLLLYLGRLGGLVAWLALVYAAIRLIPLGKWAMVLLALTPQSVARAASISYDGMTNASGYLVIALLVWLAFSPTVKAIGRRHVLALYLLTAFHVFTKPGFWTIPFVSLLIPSGKLGGRKKQVLFIGGYLVATGAMIYLAMRYTARFNFTYLPGLIDSKTQVRTILTDPSAFLGTLWNTVYQLGVVEPMLLETFFGINTWLVYDTLPTWVLVLYFAALILVLFADHAPVRPRWHHRLWFLILFSGGVFLTLTANYVAVTWPGAATVGFIAGRRFVPLVPLLPLAFANPFPGLSRRLVCLAPPMAVCVVLCASVSAVSLLLHCFIPRENLIPNGSLSQWDAALQVPEGWDMADVPGEVRGWTSEPKRSEGRLCVEQTWLRSDIANGLDRLFGVTLTGLKPYSPYRLYVRARMPTPGVVGVAAWEFDEGPDGKITPNRRRLYAAVISDPELKSKDDLGDFWVRANSAVRGPRPEFHGYHGCFWTCASGTVRLVAYLDQPTGEYPVHVIWDCWELEQISGGMPWRELWLRYAPNAWMPG